METQIIDLSLYSFAELKEIVEKAESLIEEKMETEYQKKIEGIIEVIHENKIPLAKLFREIRLNNAIYLNINKNGVSRTIYFNKNNPLEVFDGRGRKPKWFKDLELSGVDLKEHEVPLDNFSSPYFD